MRSAGVLALAFALALAASAATPPTAAAWSQGACPTSAGVTVLVDFTELGGGPATRCVPTLSSSGLAALADAGFVVTPVTALPAFVCRVDGLPGPAEESCATTPPATAYWSYWTAIRGGTWTYSAVGAVASRPVAGTVEGWSFVTGSTPEPPSVPPPPLSAPSPRPTAAPTARPTPRPTVRPTPVPTAASATVEPAASATAGPTPAPGNSDDPPSPTASATATATATATAVPAGVPPAPTPPGDPADPGPLGTLLGIGAVAIVGGAAFVARRRAGVAGG